MRPRYYCDHCKKGSGSPSFMKRHEVGCTLNPQRVCGMCALVNDGRGLAPPRDELVRIMDAEGFTTMREAAMDCPACILAALRTKNSTDEETGAPIVLGPEDGRESWAYKPAKDQWWKEFNSAQAERNYPGF